jgi:hypothetical protein
MKTVEELRAYIASRFPIVAGFACAFANTGEPYVVLGHETVDMPIGLPGVVRDGYRCELAFDEETAVMSALIAFQAYAEGKRGTVYLRVPIKLESADIEGSARYVVYMRLLISDRPAYETIEAMNERAA